jgi:hypothetical protein
MSKKETAAMRQATAAASRGAGLRAVLVLVVLLAGASATGYTLGLRNAPLGTPLPAKPKPLVQTAGVQIKDSSTLALRVNEKVLDKLAPQPDGAAPLDLLLPSGRGDYAMKFPFGSQMINLPNSIYSKNQLDAQVSFMYGQPLFRLNASITPRKGAESYHAAAGRLLLAELRQGAVSAGSSEALPAVGCPFSQFSYVHKGYEGVQEFRDVYVGPYGDYLLVLDFMAKAEYKVQAQALAAKIVASFETKWPQADRFRPQDTANTAPAR